MAQIEDVPSEVVSEILLKLDSDSLWSSIRAGIGFYEAYITSPRVLRKFTLNVDPSNIRKIFNDCKMLNIHVKNIRIDCNNSVNLEQLNQFLNLFYPILENLSILNFRFSNFNEIMLIFENLKKLRSIHFENCIIRKYNNEVLPPFQDLKAVSFYKSDENLFGIFKGQISIEKITIRSDKKSFYGFAHENFNKLAASLPNFNHLVLKGDGTGSYFDNCNFPFKLKKLEAESITFHWYVGIKTARLNFLRPQLESLEKLSITNLPMDFDGGEVLKFIIEKMNLEEFYYGKTALILNGRKQNVEEISAMHLQICSIYEIFRQFPMIKKFKFYLHEEDLACDEVENIIFEKTDLFNSVEDFEIIDNSGYRRVLGLFLPLYQNMNSIKKLTILSFDRNINIILEECLSYMNQLEVICLNSTAPRSVERFQNIKKNVKKLKKIHVSEKFTHEAENCFGSTVKIFQIV